MRLSPFSDFKQVLEYVFRAEKLLENFLGVSCELVLADKGGVLEHSLLEKLFPLFVVDFFLFG